MARWLCLVLVTVCCAAPSQPPDAADRPETDLGMSDEHDLDAPVAVSAVDDFPTDEHLAALSEVPSSSVVPRASERMLSARVSESTRDSSAVESQRASSSSCGYRMVPDEFYGMMEVVPRADSLDFDSPPSGAAFAELVQLMPLIEPYRDIDLKQPIRWALIYTGLALDDGRCISGTRLGTVTLPDEFSVECVGETSAVIHPDTALEIGDTSNSVWRKNGDEVVWRESPSPALVSAILNRRLDVPVALSGDRVDVADAGRLLVRSPPWPDSPGWEVQTMRAGSLLLVTAQPAHLACFSGVTWAFDVSTGELITCGANTMATVVARADTNADGFGSAAGWPEMQLPSPGRVPDYLACAARFDLSAVYRSSSP